MRTTTVSAHPRPAGRTRDVRNDASEHRAGTHDAVENVAYTSGDQWLLSAGAYHELVE